MITIPLKLKYRNPNKRTFLDQRKGIATGGDPIYTSTYGGGNQPPRGRKGNSHGTTPKHAKKSLRPRQRSWGPF